MHNLHLLWLDKDKPLPRLLYSDQIQLFNIASVHQPLAFRFAQCVGSGQTPQSVPALRIDFVFGKGHVGVVTHHLGLPVSFEGSEKPLIVGTCHHLRLSFK
jgi:hypothetical protein